MLKYPNGARDVESMFVDPISNDLYFVTKRLSTPELYMIPASTFDDVSQAVTMTAVGAFPSIPYFATAADISPDGRFIAIRSSNSTTGKIFERGIGESVAAALGRAGTPFTLGSELQGEAIGWAADGKSFFTTSEFVIGSSAPVHSYSFSAPLPILPGDYNNDHVVDTADFTVWRDQLDENVALPNETATPGAVTPEDYEVWKSHFGESMGVGSGTATILAVPEPTAWLLMAIGLAVAAARRTRASVP